MRRILVVISLMGCSAAQPPERDREASRSDPREQRENVEADLEHDAAARAFGVALRWR